jgi:hypothetical protein
LAVNVFFAEIEAGKTAQSGRRQGAWLASPSRFARWPQSRAILALVLLALVELAGVGPALLSHSEQAPPQAAQSDAAPARYDADLVLYERIVEAIRHGQDYYTAAANELRAAGYPMRPFVAFRPPFLAEALASLSPFAAVALLRGLVAATILVWAVRLRSATGAASAWAIGCLLVASSVVLFGQAQYLTVHEIWAGLLVALSLALRRPKYWIAAVLLGLLALLIRELALPYVAAMAAAALWERRWREACGWAAAIALFAAALAHHAAAVSAVVSAGDRVSPGWSHKGDLQYFFAAVWQTGPLRSAPAIASAALTPLALLGWAGWRAPIATRGFAVMVGYAAMLTFFGRADNFYWALLFTPLLMAGLVFAPRSLVELVAAARLKSPAPLPARGDGAESAKRA